MTSAVSKICVFCGSSSPSDPVFEKTAYRLGKLLAENGFELIYGAGNSGVMDSLANGALAKGRTVTGVTHRSEAEHASQTEGLSNLEILDTLPQRKKSMIELGDAFIILPGGIGTMDEFFEVLAAAQIGLLRKPIEILNTNGYFNNLLAWLEHAMAEQFIAEQQRSNYSVDEDPERLCQRFVVLKSQQIG